MGGASSAAASVMHPDTRLTLSEVESLCAGAPPSKLAGLRRRFAAVAASTSDGCVSWRQFLAERDTPSIDDPASLAAWGITLPKSVAGFDGAFVERLFRCRGILPSGVRVVSCSSKPVGDTAGYFSSIACLTLEFSDPAKAEANGLPKRLIAKSWPLVELAPKDFIANMFEADMRAYANFSAFTFLPRARCFLASFDKAEDRWALVLENAEEYPGGRHLAQDTTRLGVQGLLHMIPTLARFAARYENCHSPRSPNYEQARHIQPFASEASLQAFASMCTPKVAQLFDRAMSTILPSFPPGYSAKYQSRIANFWRRSKPGSGVSVTLCHGDLRGDNMFEFPDAPEGSPPLLAFDFQLMCKCVVPTDFVYLILNCAESEVLRNKETELALCRAFYDEFQRHTHAYTAAAGYTFERFMEEYLMAAHLVYHYFVCFGALHVLASESDGVNPIAASNKPLSPETGWPNGTTHYANGEPVVDMDPLFPLTFAQELGCGRITEEWLRQQGRKGDLRTRVFLEMTVSRFAQLLANHGGVAMLDALELDDPSTKSAEVRSAEPAPGSAGADSHLRSHIKNSEACNDYHHRHRMSIMPNKASLH